MLQITISFGHLMALMDFKNLDITMTILFLLMAKSIMILKVYTEFPLTSMTQPLEKCIKVSNCTVGTSIS
jgi:hypothetical protein